MKARGIAALAASVTLAAGLSACGSGGGDDSSPKTLTYWASNQGRSIQQDQQVLGPELKKFEAKTGIKVKLEVIGWPDLLNRILAATSSGQGPDVVNVGNTWSASLQATGAFQSFDDATIAKVGGKAKFIPSTLTSTGAAGKPPAFVPLYGLAYGLFYNKKLFAGAGLKPPQSWQELVADAKKLTDPAKKQYGVVMEGASYTEGAHFAFMFGRQNGANLFQGGQPGFDSPQMVAGVKQYVDLMAGQKVVNPSNAEYLNDADMLKDFAAGKAGMMMIQSYAPKGLAENGMKASEFGVVPIPAPDPLPPGGHKVSSHVAGINIGVMKSTKNKDGALKLIDFLTSPDEQKILDTQLGPLPVVQQAYSDPKFQTPEIKTFRDILANASETLPMIPQEAQFETLVGNTVKQLIADAAAGRPVDDQTIQSRLAAANKKMQSGG
ncbi:ABC transporter substrate-binding protein [Actinoallomurus iriomotensis]|uniref:Sugar ABC transporter substrate-binding protein n=1 Tax=Actinoallomurus iriomotensis TaxID=478107 RepID=A0A9W6VV59_9ACTN|nr:sugar ABC transporter substrate-binding protein [Actinoallomurus iriomotensis]GLY86333.1 sugar ABC transporter substrate-binding protein [Actinoallomurus iriomotensis]